MILSIGITQTGRRVYVKLRRHQTVLNRKSAGRRAILAAGLVENIGDVGVDGADADVQDVRDL